MSRQYEDLSRRALIKLNHDYDRDNDEALLKYLEEMDPTENYEKVRMTERIVATGDHIYDTITGNTGAIKAVAKTAVDGMLDKAVDFVGKLITG